MAFDGCYFSFDGQSCHEYGLMIYDFGSYSQDDAVSFTSVGSASEDHAANRYSSFFYGVKQDKPLTFRLVFGADEFMLDRERSLSRQHITRIAEWLTGHNSMKWLTIDQSDLMFVRYKCYISDLKLITYGNKPWAFQCTVNCDSPFGYLVDDETTITVTGSTTVHVDNPSSYKGYYRPKIQITTTAAGNVSIQNTSDNDYTMTFSSLPSGKTILVDNENQIITDMTAGDNMYPNFNFHFFRLLPGCNELTLTGNFTLTMTLAFPVDVGA